MEGGGGGMGRERQVLMYVGYLTLLGFHLTLSLFGGCDRWSCVSCQTSHLVVSVPSNGI